jgi:ATP synthase F1 delta subunit
VTSSGVLSHKAYHFARIPRRLQIAGPAGQYAHALVDAAEMSGTDMLKIHTDLSKWYALCESTPELVTFLDDPTLRFEEKLEHLDIALFKEEQFDELSSSILTMLMEEGQLGMLQEIMTSYKKLVDDAMSTVTCSITSRDALTDAQKVQVKEKIMAFLDGEYNNVNLEFKESEDVLGGLFLEIGDDYAQDLTVSSALLKAEQAMMELV